MVDGLAEELGFASVGFYAFKTTGGSNLDPEDPVTDPDGNLLIEKDICPNHDLILAITDFSLTAPSLQWPKNTIFEEQLCMELMMLFLVLVSQLITLKLVFRLNVSELYWTMPTH